jgi:hypothetical protein
MWAIARAVRAKFDYLRGAGQNSEGLTLMDTKTLAVTLMALPGFGRQRVIELLRLSGNRWPETYMPRDILNWIIKL